MQQCSTQRSSTQQPTWWHSKQPASRTTSTAQSYSDTGTATRTSSSAISNCAENPCSIQHQHLLAHPNAAPAIHKRVTAYRPRIVRRIVQRMEFTRFNTVQHALSQASTTSQPDTRSPESTVSVTRTRPDIEPRGGAATDPRRNPTRLVPLPTGSGVAARPLRRAGQKVSRHDQRTLQRTDPHPSDRKRPEPAQPSPYLGRWRSRKGGQ